MPRIPLKQELLEQMLSSASNLAKSGFNVAHALHVLEHARRTAQAENNPFPEERAQEITQQIYTNGARAQLSAAELFLQQGKGEEAKAYLERAVEYQSRLTTEKDHFGKEIQRIREAYQL